MSAHLFVEASHIPPAFSQSAALVAFVTSPAKAGAVKPSANVNANMETSVFMAFHSVTLVARGQWKTPLGSFSSSDYCGERSQFNPGRPSEASENVTTQRPRPKKAPRKSRTTITMMRSVVLSMSPPQPRLICRPNRQARLCGFNPQGFSHGHRQPNFKPPHPLQEDGATRRIRSSASYCNLQPRSRQTTGALGELQTQAKEGRALSTKSPRSERNQ